MSRFSSVFCALMAGLAALPLSGQSAVPATAVARNLKDKIVFVRADPSIGVSSMRSITVAESGPGAIGDQANEVTGAANQGGMVPACVSF